MWLYISSTMDAYREAIKGVFLLILAISGNWISETFSCETRKFLATNQYAKHFLAFMILFFSIDFVSGSNPNPVSPIQNLWMSVLIYSLYVLFTRLDIFFTVLAFLLLLTVHFIMSYTTYLGKAGGTPSEIESLGLVQNVLTVLLVGTVVFGFVRYYLRQRKEHSKNWDPIKFVLGTVSCRNA